MNVMRKGVQICSAVLFFSCIIVGTAQAQEEISPSHLKAAAKAITATKSTEKLNDILPQMVLQAKDLFSRTNPTLSAEIDIAADEVALQMLDSRLELENSIREIYARRFTEDELNKIYEFYQTDVGKKLADENTTLGALTVGAAKQWSDNLSTELINRLREELAKKGFQL